MKGDTDGKIEDALYYMHNDTLKAIGIFDEILEKEPRNIDAINGKGSALMKLNLMDDAEKLFDYSLSIRQTSSALISKGIIRKGKKDYKIAIYYYDKAIQLNPELNNIVTILKNEIIELVDGEIEIDLSGFSPDTNELIRQGLEYKKSDKLWDALNCYQSAIECDPNSFSSVQGLINEIKSVLKNELLIKTPVMGDSRIDQLKLKSLRLLLVEENPEQALTLMNLILEDDENEIDTLNQKGYVLFFFDEFTKAIECFDRCLSLDGKYHYALFNKAIVLRRQNRLNESLECFDELLKTPENYDKVKPYQLEILDKLHEGTITESEK